MSVSTPGIRRFAPRDRSAISTARGLVAASALLVACGEDVVGQSTISAGGSDTGDSVGLPLTGTDAGDTSADDTGQASGGGDSGDGDSGGVDGDGPGDDGGIGGDVCQGTQQGLCEDPGTTVHCYSGAEGTCDVGQCQGGTQSCETIDLDLGEWTACEGEVTPALEVCDGVDNDCDGQTDEELGQTQCGLGQCQHVDDNCIDGAEQSCDPMLGASGETCDGLDNDCDGDVDEDFQGQSATCGQGVCEHLVAACVDGMEPVCDPLEGASAEVCDLLDNDCDGATDEGLGSEACGQGVCAHVQDLCVAGMAQVCDPFQGASTEICDDLDNDCDGATDEGFGLVTCGVGPCEHDLQVCVDGELQLCDPLQGAAPEICDDGIDNDCDGTIDDGCVCGNGTIAGSEQCDGAALGGATCITLGHDGGILSCTASCTYDESGCWDCGDATIDPDESCDGAALGGQTCVTLGHDGGVLSCTAGCAFDESGCWDCGDGTIDPGESCDGAALGGATCTTLGHDGGALGCTAGCAYDASGCWDCGDGSIDPGEQCDGAALGGQTCAGLGFGGGTLSCTAGCMLDTTGCDDCGNGVIDPGEECDGIQLGGLDCEDYGFAFGNLSCTSSCTIDSSQCTNQCQAPASHLVCDAPGGNPFQAIGLNCPGTPNDSTPILGPTFTSPAANAWRVAAELGTSGAWQAREGNALLVLTTGALPALNAQNQVVLGTGATQLGTANANPGASGPPGPDVPVALPAPISPIDGSNGGLGGTPFVNCDGVNDCSDTLEDTWQFGGAGAYDLLWFQFDVAVPAGTSAYVFDIAWFDAEYPEWTTPPSPFEDVFVVWSTSEAYVGNVMVNFGQSFSSNAAAPFVNYEGNDPELAGTGFQGVTAGVPYGGGTGWYEVTGPTVPSETLSLTFALFETGDHWYDGTVLLDNFRWDCDGCVMGVDCFMSPAP